MEKVPAEGRVIGHAGIGNAPMLVIRREKMS